MVSALADLVAAAGLNHPHELMPEHFSRRANVHESMTFAELYPALKKGELLADAPDDAWRKAWDMARADSFAPVV
jgi:hypothetical protein